MPKLRSEVQIDSEFFVLDPYQNDDREQEQEHRVKHSRLTCTF